MGEKSWTALPDAPPPFSVPRTALIKCFHDYTPMVESSAFMFHSDMKDLNYSTMGKTVLHKINNRQKKCCAVRLVSPMARQV